MAPPERREAIKEMTANTDRRISDTIQSSIHFRIIEANGMTQRQIGDVFGVAFGPIKILTGIGPTAEIITRATAGCVRRYTGRKRGENEIRADESASVADSREMPHLVVPCDDERHLALRRIRHWRGGALERPNSLP